MVWSAFFIQKSYVYVISECRTASCFSAFSPGSLPGDFFRGVEIVGAMVEIPRKWQIVAPFAVAECREDGLFNVRF